MRIGRAFEAPNSLGKNSQCGVRFHLISTPISLPKMLDDVHTFWKHAIISYFYPSLCLCLNSSLYASIAQYIVFLHICQRTTPRWNLSSLNACATRWHPMAYKSCEWRMSQEVSRMMANVPTASHHWCRALLHKEYLKHHGQKGNSGMTPGICGAIGERAFCFHTKSWGHTNIFPQPRGLESPQHLQTTIISSYNL